MASDFGLLIGRFNTSTPSLSADNDLRELRLDSGGRLGSRLVDGNDETISYFIDGAATGSGVGDFNGAGADRGILILGKNDTDATYQILRVTPDGALVVTTEVGTDNSAHSDKEDAAFSDTDTNGEVALTVGSWVDIKTIAASSGGIIHLSGWSYGSDKNTVFQLCVVDDTLTDGVERADVIEVLDTQITTSARPSDHVNFSRALDKIEAANNFVVVFAKQLQLGSAGVGWTSINTYKTTNF